MKAIGDINLAAIGDGVEDAINEVGEWVRRIGQIA